MSYLYETHLHTCQASACGHSTGSEHARYYKDLGFQGIIVTDHFFGGNTAVDRTLSWKEKVELFCSGYEDALAEGQRIGLDVFFGWEQGYGDDEYLVYGPDKRWLLDHPEIEGCPRARQLQLVHEAGGCVIQAHPFRFRSSYMHYIKLGLKYCDGAEVANAGNNSWNDRSAYYYAGEYGLPMIAGSDNHRSVPGETDDRIFGVSLENKLTCTGDLARMILNREPIGLYVPKERFDRHPEDPDLVSWWIDEEKGLIPTGRVWPRE